MPLFQFFFTERRNKKFEKSGKVGITLMKTTFKMIKREVLFEKWSNWSWESLKLRFVLFVKVHYSLSFVDKFSNILLLFKSDALGVLGIDIWGISHMRMPRRHHFLKEKEEISSWKKDHFKQMKGCKDFLINQNYTVS